MKRRLALIPMLAVAAAVAAPTAAPATTTVKITRSAFSPKKVTIKTGDAVKWTNTDTITHQVVSNNGTFVSPVLGSGKSYASQVVSVGVQPRIAFSKGRVRFATRVTAAGSYAGHFVYVQRLSRFGEWVKIAKVKLGKLS